MQPVARPAGVQGHVWSRASARPMSRPRARRKRPRRISPSKKTVRPLPPVIDTPPLDFPDRRACHFVERRGGQLRAARRGSDDPGGAVVRRRLRGRRARGARPAESDARPARRGRGGHDQPADRRSAGAAWRGDRRGRIGRPQQRHLVGAVGQSRPVARPAGRRRPAARLRPGRARAAAHPDADRDRAGAEGPQLDGGAGAPGVALRRRTIPMRRPRSATAAAVKAFTRDDLVAFQQRWLRPDNMEIFVVSNLPLAEIMPQLEARFGTWAAPAVPKGTKTFAAPPARPTSAADRPDRPSGIAPVDHRRRPADPDRPARRHHPGERRERSAGRQFPVADQHGPARDQGLVLRRARHRRATPSTPRPTSSPRRSRPTARRIRFARSTSRSPCSSARRA